MSLTTRSCLSRSHSANNPIRLPCSPDVAPFKTSSRSLTTFRNSFHAQFLHFQEASNQGMWLQAYRGRYILFFNFTPLCIAAGRNWSLWQERLWHWRSFCRQNLDEQRKQAAGLSFASRICSADSDSCNHFRFVATFRRSWIQSTTMTSLLTWTMISTPLRVRGNRKLSLLTRFASSIVFMPAQTSGPL